MGIGTSLGAFFETDFHHQAGIDDGVLKPKDTGDDNVAPPDDPKEPDTAKVIPVGFMDKLLGTNGEERHQLWPERMVRDALQTSHDVGAGKIPMWEMDPESGDLHTSIEGLHDSWDLLPFAVGGSMPARIRLNDPIATTDKPGTIPPEEAARLARQPSNIVEHPVEKGHPLSPEEAANRYHNLPSGENIRFAHEYEEHASDSQWAEYEHLVNDPHRQVPFEGDLSQFESSYQRHLDEAFSNEEEVRTTYSQQKIAEAKAKFVDNPTVTKKGNIILARDPEVPSHGNLHFFNFLSDEGVPGEINIREKADGKEIHVGWIGTVGSPGPMDVGKSEIRNLLYLLRDRFPKAEEISGFRVSGARNATGKLSDARMRLPGRGNPNQPLPPRKTIDELVNEWDNGD